MKCACITRHRGEYPVRLMCRVLAVSPAAYYAARRPALSARARADERPCSIFGSRIARATGAMVRHACSAICARRASPWGPSGSRG